MRLQEEHQAISLDELKPPPKTDSKTVEEIRNSITSLLSRKKNLDGRIRDALGSLNLKPGQLKGIKIELDNKGKIAVGGIEDLHLTRRIEKALNAQKGLYSALKGYQRDEAELNGKIYKETGTGIGGLRTALLAVEYATDNLASGENGDVEHWGKALADANNELERIMGADLFRAAPDLVELASDLATFADFDFSSEKRGVGDSEGALKKVLTQATNDISRAFNDFNKKLAAAAASPDENISKQMTLDNVEITIDAAGRVAIKGAFSENADSNGKAEAIVREHIAKMIAEDEATTGRESIFHTATRQMLRIHDEDYGEKVDKKVMLQIANGKVDAYIQSPGADEERQADIREEAALFLKRETGVEISMDDLEVKKHGRIAFTKAFTEANTLPDRMRQALASLNSHILELMGERQNMGLLTEPEKTGNTARTIVSYLKEIATYRPGGLTGLDGEAYDPVLKFAIK